MKEIIEKGDRKKMEEYRTIFTVHELQLLEDKLGTPPNKTKNLRRAGGSE